MCGSIEGPWSNISAFLRNEGWRVLWNRSWARPLSIGVYNAQHGASGDNFILLDTMREAKQSGSLPSIYKLLFENRRLSCGDARDRVYAFLSLIHENDQSIFNIDYRRSVSQVYLNTAKSLITAHGSLYVLNCQRAPASRGMNAGQNELYSPFDQAHFIDADSQITDESGNSRKGWAKLPVGWERRVELVHDGSWYPGMSAVVNFVDHITGRVSETSPLENISAVQPLHEDEWRRLTPEWHKLWDNTGKLRFEYKVKGSSSDSEDDDEPLDLPTWVPNWNCYSTRDPALLLEFQKSAPVFWASGKGQKVDLLPDTLSYSGRVLKLRGVLYDEIQELGESWHPEPGMIPLSRSGIRALEQWDDIALRQPKACPYNNADGRADAYWRTTIADHAGDAAFVQGDIQWFDIWCNRTNWLPEGHRPWAFSCAEIEEEWSHSKPYSELAAMLELKNCIAKACVYGSIDHERGVLHSLTSVLQKSYQYGHGVYDGKNVEEVYKEFRARIVKACANRRILVSAKGYIGLAPWNARTGDTIAVLQGGCTPFLLRRVEKGYELVGEIYVYGIMGGEIFQSKPKMETIDIV